MSSYIILSRFSPDALGDPRNLKKFAETVSGRIKTECPAVKWKESFVTAGRFDVVDIVESDDPAQVERAAMIIRGYGHALTEIMMATPWKEFIAGL
jgi:uncharacterized protein with GYD domain